MKNIVITKLLITLLIVSLYSCDNFKYSKENTSRPTIPDKYERNVGDNEINDSIKDTPEKPGTKMEKDHTATEQTKHP
jgi:hypothetical protein